jgi:hypothetical protein
MTEAEAAQSIDGLCVETLLDQLHKILVGFQFIRQASPECASRSLGDG